MTELDDVKQDLEIAKHNLWVAKTTVEDWQKEVNRLHKKYISLQGIEDTQGLIDKGLLL